MDHRRLGSTNIELSVIGFGAFKIGRDVAIKYPAGYELPGDREVESLLNGVLDLGINYIDTAPAYGESERRIGQFLAHRRDEFVLSTKVGETFANGTSRYDFSAAAVTRSLKQSLQRLRTDHVDIVFVHSSGDDVHIIENTGVVEALQQARDAGHTRCIGFSGKTVEGDRAALAWADAIMVEYHLDDTSHEAVMREAVRRGVGVIVKKGLASGHLDAREAIPFVLRNEGVASMVIGGLNLEHIGQNVMIAGEPGG